MLLQEMQADRAMQIMAFLARPHAGGGAIELSYHLPNPTQPVEALPLVVLRRLRRFPGGRRRGDLPIEAEPGELTDGHVIFNSASFSFDREEVRETIENDLRVVIISQFKYSGNPRDRILVRQIKKTLNDTGLPSSVQVTLFDRDQLSLGEIHYYTAFVGAQYIYSGLTQGQSLATSSGRFDLFDLLPTVHKQKDTLLPPARTVANNDLQKGQLQRFLDVFSAHADMLSDEVAAIAHIHNPRKNDARILPHLAQMLGWKLFTYTNEEDQRSEILFSSQVYRSLGSSQTLADIINRLTGWETRVREYAADVLMSFDSERIEVVNGNTIYLDGHTRVLDASPWITGSIVPRGSVDTADLSAMFKLRTRAVDDTTAYTYDTGIRQANGEYLKTNDTRYNRETIGVYIIPDVETELFALEQEWSRIGEILIDLIPAQTRLVFTVLPGLVYEDARLNVLESYTDLGIEQKSDSYSGAQETAGDTIPGLRWLISNHVNDLSVDTANLDLTARSVHIGLIQS